MALSQTLNPRFKHTFTHVTTGRKYLINPTISAGCQTNAQNFMHVTHSQSGASGNISTRLSTGVFAHLVYRRKAVVITENAKRPSAVTRRPLLVHPLVSTNGGTVPESTDGREIAAVTHLNLIFDNPVNAAHFVRLAYVYGVTVPRIVVESGLPVETVQRMLLDGDRW